MAKENLIDKLYGADMLYIVLGSLMNGAFCGRTKKVGKKLAFTARVKTELVTYLGSLMTPQVAYMETLVPKVLRRSSKL